jgi:hypothetical protein
MAASLAHSTRPAIEREPSLDPAAIAHGIRASSRAGYPSFKVDDAGHAELREWTALEMARVRARR